MIRRLGFVSALVGLGLTTSASPVQAAVTIGQVAATAPPNTCSNLSADWLQPTVVSGNPYAVPAVGRITSWSTRASSTAGQHYTMKVFRHVNGSSYTVVGHDGPRPLVSGAINTFTTNVAVMPGDLLGMNDNDTAAPVSTACTYVSPGNSVYFRAGGLVDAGSGSFASSAVNSRMNIQAVFEPSNSFSFGSIARNKKKGTATINLTLPNPGELAGSGNGAKVASAAGAVISKSVGAGPAQLLVKAKGSKRRKLIETGKVKLNVAITYTPTNGNPSSQSVKVKLKKNL